jgi:pSer/pThr/pTyr-binding forkhead associated (FHA) protein
MKVTLTVHGKELNGKPFRFTEQGSFLFGSAPDATCRITGDPYVSRHHFYLLVGISDVRLRDLQSTNGTEVDGKLYRGGVSESEASPLNTFVKGEDPPPGEDVLLRDGSVIEVGYTKISVVIEADVECALCGATIPPNQKSSAKSGDAYICQDCRSKHIEEGKRVEKVLKLINEGNAFLGQRKGREALAKFQEAEKLDAVNPNVRVGLAKARQLIARPVPPPVVGAGGRGAGPAPAGGRSDVLLRAILEQLNMPRPKGPIPKVPGYEIVQLLAQGGMGAVFEGRRQTDGAKVAIKVILPDRPLTRETLSRFRREIQLTRELCSSHPLHPNIVQFFDGGDANGLLWMALEFIERGWDISHEMRQRGGRIPRNEAVGYMLKALDGLSYAHGKAIIHRDLKPPNILLAPGSPRFMPKVTDFGLAKCLENAQLNMSIVTKPGASMGTLPYMPPEQVVDVRTATRAADVFSMGATLYHMLTGHYNRNYARNQNVTIRQVVQDKIVPVQDRDRTIPTPLALVINRSQELEPEKRYPDGAALREALVEAARQSGIPV